MSLLCDAKNVLGKTHVVRELEAFHAMSFWGVFGALRRDAPVHRGPSVDAERGVAHVAEAAAGRAGGALEIFRSAMEIDGKSHRNGLDIVFF